MSLKLLHIVFIVASCLLCAGFGAWSLNEYLASGSLADLGMSLLGFGLVPVLVLYGRAFLKKLRRVPFL